MPKKRRQLWLNVKANFSRCKKPPTRKQFIKKLLASIRNGSYKVPKCWDVTLFWRNKFMAPWREGEWTKEMNNSAQSSTGWDIAVSSWLERKL